MSKFSYQFSIMFLVAALAPLIMSWGWFLFQAESLIKPEMNILIQKEAGKITEDLVLWSKHDISEKKKLILSLYESKNLTNINIEAIASSTLLNQQNILKTVSSIKFFQEKGSLYALETFRVEQRLWQSKVLVPLKEIIQPRGPIHIAIYPSPFNHLDTPIFEATEEEFIQVYSKLNHPSQEAESNSSLSRSLVYNRFKPYKGLFYIDTDEKESTILPLNSHDNQNSPVIVVSKLIPKIAIIPIPLTTNYYFILPPPVASRFFTEPFLLFLLSGIFISLCIGWYFRNYFVLPIQRLTKASEEVAKGNLNKRIIQCASQSDIKNTIVQFNKMLDEIEERKDLEKNFFACLAHDFRTPLLAEKRTLEILQSNLLSKKIFLNFFFNYKKITAILLKWLPLWLILIALMMASWLYIQNRWF